MSQFFPIEPSADVRQSAKAIREMYVAFCDEGFSETQALYIIGSMLGGAK